MELTEEKMKVKLENKKNMTLKNKIIFLFLILIMIVLVAVIVNVTYMMFNSKEKEIKVSGILIESDDYSDLLLVEIAKQVIPEEVKTVNVSTTPEETRTKSKNENSEVVYTNAKSVNGSPYYIKVNYTTNTVTIYGLDSEEKYTKPVKAMICSSGAATPRSGVYKTSDKYRWGLLYGNVWGQYSTRIVGSILFHSVPYNKQSPSSLKVNYYDKLGLAVSAGCIRLTTGDAKWIYDNCPKGTMVEFYSSSDPGPLGKPSAMKISGYPSDLNCWDPTDPDLNNPWIEYFNEQKKQETETIQETSEVTQIPQTSTTPNSQTEVNTPNITNETPEVNTINNITNEITEVNTTNLTNTTTEINITNQTNEINTISNNVTNL